MSEEQQPEAASEPIMPTEEQKKAASFQESLVKIAQKKCAQVLKLMEVQRLPQTLSLHWPKIKQGFHSGYVNGLLEGFRIGYKTAQKMAAQETAVPPSEPEPANAEQMNLPGV